MIHRQISQNSLVEFGASNYLAELDKWDLSFWVHLLFKQNYLDF